MFEIVVKTIILLMLINATFQDGSFSKVSNKISYEELKILPTHAFKDYPSPMGWETFILIESTNLTTIEPEAFLNVRIHRLDITHNEVETLTMVMFVNVSLRNFYLNDNKIKSIQPGTFNDIHSYDTNSSFTLSLYGNKLKSINKGIFNNLDIGSLYLQKNLINFIEKESFNYMPKLEYLNLSNNLLETIDVGIFQNLGDSIYIQLKENKIAFVESKAFENNTHLRLNLEKNKVSIVKGYFTNSPDIIRFDV